MDKIAVVGMSGIFPGALNLEQFWCNIVEKRESIIDVSTDIKNNRWILKPEDVLSSDYRPDTACSRRAGLVTGFEFNSTQQKFNSTQEGLNPTQEGLKETLHQMVLHTGQEALSQCYNNQEIRKRTGVVLAAISLPTAKSSELAWQIIMENKKAINSIDALAAGMVSVPAALLARVMGLMGGCFTLDAACASSLYAIKIACEKLDSGKVDMMVAGGVSRPDSLYTQIGFTQLRALSPSGKCSPFDKNADGLVVGEGAGIVVLKRLEDAVECGDHIWGVITGAGWSNDIKGNLVAPASEGQIRAMKAAYKSAGWAPSDVQYIECHGSATPVGDNIELNSMSTLWKEYGLGNQGCSIGSVKSMIGHLLTAAGVAGFIKTLLAMDRKILPPSLNFSEPAPNSPLFTTKFHVQTKPEEWKTGIRRAGISAFGFGGINAHILVEEFTSQTRDLKFPQTRDLKSPQTRDLKSPPIRDLKSPQIRDLKSPQTQELTSPQTQNLKQTSPIAIVGMEFISGEQGWEFSKTERLKHIPPNQIEDLLPQHLIILKAAMGAIKDAGISPRPDNQTTRTDFGAVIGIEFDYGATDFYLRWRSKDHENNLPLTPTRTLGALGGIVASRIAREFKIGGPCFTVSAGAASGIKAIDIAMESLRQGETTVFLCGAVDMAGDVRQDTLNRTLRTYVSDYDDSAPFDKDSKGVFASEGACAVVLKTLEQAQKDKDRIYAVIQGTGTASGGAMLYEKMSYEKISHEKISHEKHINLKNIYATSLSNALNDAGVSMSDIGLYQAHGSGDPIQDNIEIEVLREVAVGSNPIGSNPIGFNSIGSYAIASTSATIGDTHAASGLLSVIEAARALYNQIIPPLAKFKSPKDSALSPKDSALLPKDNAVTPFYFPKFPAFWIKEDFQTKRRACVASITTDGTCSHLVVEEFIIPSDPIETTQKQENEITQKQENEITQKKGKIAFLYPGSGNHFLGMGRGIKALFPDILRRMKMNEDGAKWINSYPHDIISYPDDIIFGQVSFGVLMTRVAEKFGIKPDACIGHSLGETAGLFALRVWNNPEDMLKRMKESDLFTSKLAGECTAAAKVWKLKKGEIPNWRVATVNRSKDFVKNIIQSGQFDESRESHKSIKHDGSIKSDKSNRYDRLYLLIVNTPDECVIGGSCEQVEHFIRETGCGAIYLDGVVTVHCPVVKECSEEYLNLHKFESHPPQNIDFYSCFSGKKYIPETWATAQSILNQALYGFDYTELINNAWNDGIRVFIEMGPGSSCTRAVSRILGEKPHLAVSLSSNSNDENEEATLIKALLTLAENGVDVDKSELLCLAPIWREFRGDVAASAKITADAHIKFLEFSQQNMVELKKQFFCLTQIASNISQITSNISQITPNISQITDTLTDIKSNQIIANKVLFDRNMCIEFAVGLAENVLGESFKIIDTYPVRVRLPDEPLMLVDRIIDIQGEMLSLKSGKIITQHDVKHGAWYLDGGKAPVSISIEAGQADLFLCSWLGIDHVVQGKRRYRLLDAKVTFHRTLPESGETIEYHIEIDRFLKQGEIYLFFFHYKGFINSELLISMRDGCAGFFTLEEVQNSGGIILKKDDSDINSLTKSADINSLIKAVDIKPLINGAKVFKPLVPLYREKYNDAQVENLRLGNLEGCFGKLFEGIILGKNLRLPGDRMHLIDRVLDFNPTGGKFGMGLISAETDIHPDDWFLTCHFVDDMVMPGTLMYECCAHGLRIFTQRMGWISTKDEPFYDVIPGIESDLKCRGPVTTKTKKARYEIEIKEMGYFLEPYLEPYLTPYVTPYLTPYVIADAHMFSDDHRIVLYKNMGMKIVGLSRGEIELLWKVETHGK